MRCRPNSLVLFVLPPAFFSSNGKWRFPPQGRREKPETLTLSSPTFFDQLLSIPSATAELFFFSFSFTIRRSRIVCSSSEAPSDPARSEALAPGFGSPIFAIEMEEAMEMARSKDTKERLAAVERLHQSLESSRRSLSSGEATALVDCCMDLLRDNNFRVAQGALHALSSAAVLSGENLKLHLNALVPAVVERLGDGKQPVRDAARQLLVTLMEVSSPTIIVERAGSFAWTHKSWRVREEFARTAATAISLFASVELTLPRVMLSPVLQLLNDPNHSVREAATSCIEEAYTQVGPQFFEELQHHHIPSSMMKDISARLERIEPKVRPLDGGGSQFISSELKASTANQKKGSPRTRIASRETSLSGGEADVTEKSVEPVKVYSEKELIREFEKIASTLVPEKDWSLRISAMQRIEGLVYGGAADYPSFPLLLKQLVPSLSTQLSDRRSSIVKQACHLLCFLSKELLGDFESCAEMFIPVLFKLVVITVLVIAESADNCIKTMLRNCKVARLLPRIADCAKNDKSAVLRARCCEYALLILEYWADAPEIQRSADLYEDLIKCCVADAMSEVRSTARTCYRMFAKTWPERSRRLFQSFDPVIQRLINDEDGGMHRRYASPSIHERGLPVSRSAAHASAIAAPGYGASTTVAMDRSSSVASGFSFSVSSRALSQAKPPEKGSERTLESVLNSSKQKVSAIENLLRGVGISEKQRNSTVHSTSLDLGVDPPSARDPPVPAVVPASNPLSSPNPQLVDSSITSIPSSFSKSGGSSLISAVNAQNPAIADHSRYDNVVSDPVSALSLPYMARSSERPLEGGNLERMSDTRFKKIPNMLMDRQYLDGYYRESEFRDPHGSFVPNFQRPLLRKQVTGRASASGRSSFDDSQLQLGELSNYMDGPASLIDALNEGLSSTSDWVARVSAFTYLRNLLQQGSKGILEVTQSFEKVMKLFFRYLDDPHHKVAQAALSTLAEIIPACRKPFESYIERILPHVFSRLIDPKQLVRQPCTTTLEIVGRTYAIDSLLPALVRSLDEQRSPKAKLAVINFANNSFNKHSPNPDGYSNNGFLKLWLSKLAPLVSDKNMKLKEASISGIIAVYTHFDSVAALNYILCLSVEEQNLLRRALKQYTPRIEVDLVNFLQSKKEKQRSKTFYDQTDAIGTSSDDGYFGASKKSQYLGRYTGGSLDSEDGRKWNSMQESILVDASIAQATSDETRQTHLNIDAGSDSEVIGPHKGVLRSSTDAALQNTASRANNPTISASIMDNECYTATPRLDISRLVSSDCSKGMKAIDGDEMINNLELNQEKVGSATNSARADNEISIPQLLHHVCVTSDNDSNLSKREALRKLVEASVNNDSSVWAKYFNQILTCVLEVLDDPDSSIRELDLNLILEMLNNQKEMMEDSVEIVIEKLLHVAKDSIAKVSNEAQCCLTIVLTRYDPFRCLAVIIPMLVSEDEKTLVNCINCLNKVSLTSPYLTSRYMKLFSEPKQESIL
ncbi:CLIP-associated protein [Apostasia shenzhenica]|uniref:CLIP-associated protein n=1 Tax=Apostasia shenzhenica TaxID=1088818 RepID=A0A2I0AM39_9ASPA|nr:CLIP-associated protein [Apostasia shenzhenica]